MKRCKLDLAIIGAKVDDLDDLPAFMKLNHIHYVMALLVWRRTCDLQVAGSSLGWAPLRSARTSATNYFNRPFQALSENVFIRADIAFSALDTLFNDLYKFTYLLTYLHSGLGQATYTCVSLSPSSIIWCRPTG